MDHNVRPDDLLDRIEHARVRGQIVGPAMKEVGVAGLRGTRTGAELLAEVFVRAAKPRGLFLRQDRDGKNNSPALIRGDFFFAQ